ncbi:Transcription factor MYB122 [Vitis vinifera]|uniref:Transcription factor MYB122 n=1 Tax=Vitis vinifera TaxID=29760 RepID=A0A438GGD1_VITVI|nr:Transcription factor MYB122 [Vitis vinifera]
MAASQEHGRNGLKKSPWTPKEDQKLIRYMKRHGEPTRWTEVPKLARLNKCGKSCRLRWSQYLKPGIKRGNFSQDEEDTIIRLQSDHGNRLTVKSRTIWNTSLKKKLAKKEIPPATQTPLFQPLLAAAVFLDSCVNYIRAYALRLHSDARLPNPQPHGVGFISTNPTGAFPAQGPGFNYQAMEDPTVYYPDQPCWLFIWEYPPTTQTPIQPLLAVADWLASITAYVRSYAPGLHSDAQLPNLHSLHNPVVQQGFGDITPDPEAQLHGVGSISIDPAGALPGQGPGFNYLAMEDPTVYSHPDQFGPLITSIPNTGVLIPDPKVNNNYAADIGSLFGNVPNAGSTPALMVSESSERSMTNQVENEMTPPTEEISPLEAWLEEFLFGENDETSDSFCEDVALVL